MGNFAVWVEDDNTYTPGGGDPLHFQKLEEAHKASLLKQEEEFRQANQAGLANEVARMGNQEDVDSVVAAATAWIEAELGVDTPSIVVAVEKYGDQKMVAVWHHPRGGLRTVKSTPWGWVAEGVEDYDLIF